MTYGYLHSAMDVRILILFILSRLKQPADIDTIYEIGVQDDSLNYFMLSDCVSGLIKTGHIIELSHSRFTITDKGRAQGSIVEDSLAIPVVQKVEEAIAKKNDEFERAAHIETNVSNDNGNYVATLKYNDRGVPLLSVSLSVPDETTGQLMADNLRKNFNTVYKACIDAAMDANRKPVNQN